MTSRTDTYGSTGQVKTRAASKPVRIDDEFRSLITPLTESERAQLERNIVADGCRDPLVTWQGVLLDGHNRHDICVQHGIVYATASVTLADRLDAKIWIRENQRGRRNLNDDQRAMNAAALAELLSEKTKRDRAKKGGHARHGTKPESCLETASASKQKPLRSRATAAKQQGISERRVRQAQDVRKKAPDLAEKVARGEMPLAAAGREVQKRERAEIRKNPPPIQTNGGTFQVLYADPPWRYDFSKSDSRGIENQYPTLSVEDICALDVPALCEPDCVLFLWATSPKLPQAMAVMEAWGFTYKTCMVWVKDKIGMGYYARQRHELLLIGTKGKPPVPFPEDRPDSVIEAPRGRHSEKPPRCYEIIEAMYPNGSRIELFARTARDTWSAWGNETI